ncbi:ABC transporter transmembrane domain-containing protein, partial [Kibdelosporangium lantanae]
KVLGQATDLIFAGIIGKSLPANLTKDQIVAGLRAQGDNTKADMLASIDLVPGQGIDFTAVGHVLLWVLGLYFLSSVFAYVQGYLTTTVVQRAVFTMREQVEEKFARLPLRYFDQQPRGEVLSRVTNDIDNIAQSLQQTMSQLLTSLLSVVGVLVLMFVISPLLAVIALVTVPLMIWVSTRIGKRAQPQFIKQWSTTGRLNGHIEEVYTGHALVKAFGQQEAAAETFEKHNNGLYEAGFKAQFVSGLIQPAMMFIGNLNYVLVAVVGALRELSVFLSAPTFRVEAVLPDDVSSLSKSVEVAAYRIVAEALTNVVKHAQATSATVRLVIDERGVVVEVEDDGVGFPEDASSRGMGLKFMAQRAQEISGEFSCRTTGAGSLVRAVLPLSR